MANKYTRKGRERGNAPSTPFPVDDEFVSLTARIWRVIEPHLRYVGYGMAGLVVAVAAGWVALYWMGRGKQEATEMFGQAVRIYEAELLGPDEKPKSDGSPEDPPHFKTAKERADATLAALDKLERAHGSTKVARRGRSVRAGVLYDQGRYVEAADLWRKVAEEADPNDPLKAVAREGVGLCLENQGKLDDALVIFKEIESAAGGFLKDRAQLDQARVLTAKGNRADAEKLYKGLLERVPQGGLHDKIQDRLAALGS